MNDAGTMKQALVSDFASYMTGSSGKGGLLVDGSGKMYIQHISDVFLSGGLTQGLTASFSTTALSASVQVFLNGMLQTRSGSVGASASGTGGAEYDYRFDSLSAPTKVYMAEALDSDDVLTVRYMKR